MRMQTWRRTELLQMLDVTTDHHWQPKPKATDELKVAVHLERAATSTRQQGELQRALDCLHCCGEVVSSGSLNVSKEYDLKLKTQSP